MSTNRSRSCSSSASDRRSRRGGGAGEARSSAPPDRRDQARAALGYRARSCPPAGTARRRTRSGRPAAARGGTRRTPRRRLGRWCRTAWPSSRSKLSSANGSDSASARAALTFEPEPPRVGVQRRDHPGRDVGAGGVRDDPGLEQVEAEVAGAGADLERAVVALVELGAEQLAELAEHLALADLAEVDPPLGVVRLGRDVVVARVDVADLVGCCAPPPYGARRLPCRASMAEHLRPAGSAPRRPAARADRRAHAARRPRRELLVPAPSGRLRVDRRARRSASAWSTWPAARDTARRCCRAAPRRCSASTPTRRRTSTRGCAIARQNLRFERGLVETLRGARRLRRRRVPADDRARPRPGGGARATSRGCWRPAARVYVSTPNLLTLAPPGAEKSDEPVAHQGVPRARVRCAVPDRVRRRSSCWGLVHARRLRAHALALRLGWDAVHPRLHLTKPFYDRFTPAIASSDFTLRPYGLDRALDFLAVCRSPRVARA